MAVAGGRNEALVELGYWANELGYKNAPFNGHSLDFRSSFVHLSLILRSSFVFGSTSVLQIKGLDQRNRNAPDKYL